MPVRFARRRRRRHLFEDVECRARKFATQISSDEGIPEKRFSALSRMAVEDEAGGGGVAKGEVFGNEEAGYEEIVVEAGSEGTRMEASEKFGEEAAGGDDLRK